MSAESKSGTGRPALGVREYGRCLIALLVLSALALGAAFVHIGAFTVPAALLLAALKATLVAAYFMHLVEEPPSHRIAAFSGVVLLLILIAFTVADVVERR